MCNYGTTARVNLTLKQAKPVIYVNVAGYVSIVPV